MKTGLLITNLGTPAAPTAQALRPYLSEFLSDPRVVENPKPLWWCILHGIILRIRPKRSANLYQKIWTPEGSPLLVNSQKIATALQQQLAQEKPEAFLVESGMRYDQPSIRQALERLQKAQCNRIIVLPLFPQYSAAATASTFDAVAAVFKRWRVIPELHMITHYHDHPLYINAIANSIRQHWQQHGKQQHLLFSFHGLPQRCVNSGDPYQQQCQTTAHLVAEQLVLPADTWSVVFQSRFGRAPWLQPYCDITLKAMPARGINSVCVICPGFAADCLETLEEINQLNRRLFLQAGGTTFHYIPALNDSLEHIALLKNLVTARV